MKRKKTGVFGESHCIIHDHDPIAATSRRRKSITTRYPSPHRIVVTAATASASASEVLFSIFNDPNPLADEMIHVAQSARVGADYTSRHHTKPINSSNKLVCLQVPLYYIDAIVLLYRNYLSYNIIIHARIGIVYIRFQVVFNIGEWRRRVTNYHFARWPSLPTCTYMQIYTSRA